MKTSLHATLILLTGFWLTGASAQPGGPGMGGTGGMGLGPAAEPSRVCRGTADPQACEERRRAMRELREKAVDACRDVAGPERRRCIRDIRMAGQDCAKSASPARCAQVRDAYAKCRTQVGPQLRTCMDDELPPPDCRKAPDPSRCAAAAKAREACKTTAFGPERRQCMAVQLGGN
jgi:hypothetical protein